MFAKALLLAFLPAALAVNHAVSIGFGGALVFNPNQVTAAIGDTVTFTVVNGNHSTTTTVFSGAVCPPPPGGVGPNGWDSGFMSDLDGSMPHFTYTVVDTKPHFAACMRNAGAHCRAGMTFALNPTAAQTYAQFNANARAS
ncbi:hypothetical protein C8J57DRAFT_1525538 [Mycena rebaudengoi]|nr:hypothetical protein C8J57DRAFT_1477120 [Mycena rebaudengoi]KAJ7243791.1 hypothetical protein C8J57DRAFT_1525538 [Mycena rebaudengoi]